MGKRLYVGNLSYESTADSLRTAFEAGGRTVTDVFLMTDRETGRPRGFGFVEMGSDDEAQAAIRELDGAELDGRNITVSEARERQSTGSSGGPRGPRGARGDGGGLGDGGARSSRRGGARGGRGGGWDRDGGGSGGGRSWDREGGRGGARGGGGNDEGDRW